MDSEYDLDHDNYINDDDYKIGHSSRHLIFVNISHKMGIYMFSTYVIRTLGGTLTVN